MAVMTAGVVFTSCEKNADPKLIEGTWDATVMIETLNGVTDTLVFAEPDYMSYTFTGKDLVYSFEYKDPLISTKGTWTLEKNVLDISYEDGAKVPYNVIELTAKTMVLSVSAGDKYAATCDFVKRK